MTMPNDVMTCKRPKYFIADFNKTKIDVDENEMQYDIGISFDTIIGKNECDRECQ